ncbi:uncharacterized protein LOC111111136 isoform X3 [Crassostrea virginica]
MARVEGEEVDRYKDVDIESILARVERRGPLTLARKRTLYRAPEFVRRLAQEITVNEGATVCFDCKVVAFPNPTITWTKDGETLPEDTRYLTETVDNGEYALKISDVRKNDEAAYRCRAENVEATKKDKPKKQQLSHSQTFPVIKEEVEKEEVEAEFFQNQPDSPLTSLYCGTRWKNRTWPDFLYDQCFAVNYYADVDFETMDTDEDDVFLPENHVPCFLPRDIHDNSDSDSEMDNVLKQNLIFENRNLLILESSYGLSANEQDINANTYRETCSTRTVKQNGDLAHSTKSLVKRPCAVVLGNNCRRAVQEADGSIHCHSTQAEKNYGVQPIFCDAPGMSLALFILLISGYTFIGLNWNFDPGTFVCFELFVEFLFLITSTFV